MKDYDYIVFGEDFSRHPHCLEHLMRKLLPTRKILWIETIGTRSPRISLYDLKRSFEVLKKWMSKRNDSSKKAFENLDVVNPPCLPFNQFGFIRKINQLIFKRYMSPLLHKLDKIPVVVTSVVHSSIYFNQLGDFPIVYYCVDDFKKWPYCKPKLVSKLERNLLDRADVAFFSSDWLLNTKAISSKNNFKLDHGVDVGHFKLPKVRSYNKNLCFFGLIDQRFDFELLDKISRSFSDHIIYIIGPIQGVKPLRSPNITYLGPVEYKDLPHYLEAMDVFILPYKRNKLMKTISPLKLREYLATGRPVVTIDIPETEHWKEYVKVAKGPGQFIDKINEWSHSWSQYDRDRILAHLDNSETWHQRAKYFESILESSFLNCPLRGKTQNHLEVS